MSHQCKQPKRAQGDTPCARSGCQYTTSYMRAGSRYCCQFCIQKDARNRARKDDERMCQIKGCKNSLAGTHGIQKNCNLPTCPAQAGKKLNALTALSPEALGHFMGVYGTRNRVSEMGSRYRKLFGISLGDYFTLYQQSGGRCYICRNPERVSAGGKRPNALAVDHNQGLSLGDAGYVRGLLCFHCNRRLGNLERGVWGVQAAAYLSSPRPVLVPPAELPLTPKNLQVRGVTENQYLALVAAQGGLCHICNLPERDAHKRGGKAKRLALDHDHRMEIGTAGCVRGLLCGKCNTRLSDVENPNWRPLADTYLAAASALEPGELPSPAWNPLADPVDLDISAPSVQQRRSRPFHPFRKCALEGCPLDVGYLDESAECCSPEHTAALQELRDAPAPPGGRRCEREACRKPLGEGHGGRRFCPGTPGVTRPCRGLKDKPRSEVHPTVESGLPR